MKKLFTLFLVFLTCAGTMFAVTINGLNYNLDEVNKTAEVSSYNSVSGSLIIPSSVTYNDVIYSVTSIGFVAFTDCTGLTSVEIPNSVTIIGNQAFQNCSNLIDLTIGNNVTSIGRYAFYNCSSLTSVEIPDGVSSIGEAAFLYCNLENVTLPNSVTSIGNNAFNGNNNLASPIYNSHIFARLPISYSGEYVIPEGIESIAGGSFVGSTNLTAITIPNSVTYIGLAAFYTCSGIETLTIGSNVSIIDHSAFEGCSGLTSIACKAVTPPACGFLTLDGIDYSIPLYVPEESIDLYKADYTWNVFANILPLATTPTAIENPYAKFGKSQKLLRQGNIYILTDDSQTYTLTGQQVK